MWPRQCPVRLNCKNTQRFHGSPGQTLEMPADAISSNSFKFHLNLDPFKAMATRSDAVPARWRRPFLAWLDGIEKGRGIAVATAGFAPTRMPFLGVPSL